MDNNTYQQIFPADTRQIVTPVRIEDAGGTRYFEGVALWDTGAERTVIAECVAQTLRLDTMPLGRMCLPQGESDVEVGAVLVFPGNVRRFVLVATAVMEGRFRTHDCILGMDIISQGKFSLSREGDTIVFRFQFGEGFRRRP